VQGQKYGDKSQAANGSHDATRIFEMQLRISFQKVLKTFSYFSDLSGFIAIFLALHRKLITKKK
jgi:hypothetical protein